MTPKELEQKTREAIFGPKFRQKAFSTMLVHDVQLDMARAAIRVVLEEALDAVKANMNDPDFIPHAGLYGLKLAENRIAALMPEEDAG